MPSPKGQAPASAEPAPVPLTIPSPGHAPDLSKAFAAWRELNPRRTPRDPWAAMRLAENTFMLHPDIVSVTAWAQVSTVSSGQVAGLIEISRRPGFRSAATFVCLGVAEL